MNILNLKSAVNIFFYYGNVCLQIKVVQSYLSLIY